MRRAALIAILIAIAALLAARPAGAAEGDAPSSVETALIRDPAQPHRLLLAVWPAEGWVVRQQGAVAEILFPGSHMAIDTSTLLGEGATGPLTGVRVSQHARGTELALELGCACTVAVHGDGETRLAIDIVSAEIAAGPILRSRGPAPLRAPAPPARPAPHTATGPSTAPAPAPKPGGAAPPARDGQDRVAGDPAPGLVAARDRLIRQLERAADAGLITLAPAPDAPPERDAAPAAAQHSQSAEDPAPREAPRGAPDAAPAITAEPDPDASDRIAPPDPRIPGVGMARARRLSEPEARTSDPGEARERRTAGPPRGIARAEDNPVCYPDSAFELPGRMGPAALSRRVGMLRRHLIGEFDRPNRAAAVALARLYLAHRMGAEARLALASFAPAASATPLLATLSHLVDGAAPPPGHALSRSDCRGRHRLWHALARALAGKPAQAVAAAQTAGRALERMDPGLRAPVATALGHAAAEIEDWTAAHRFAALVERSRLPGRPARPDEALLQARLARRDGDAERAAALLHGLWGEEGRAGAAALLRLAEIALANSDYDARDTRGLRLDLGALARTARGTSLGARALVAEARLAHAALGRGAALDLLAFALDQGQIDAPHYRRAVAALAAEPGHEGETPLALLHARDPGRYRPAMDDPGFRIALARSYAAIGAPEMAERVLAQGDLLDGAPAADIARAYLDATRPDAAARLAGRLPDGPEHAALRARIAAAGGDADGALAVLARAPEAGRPPRLRARLAWRAQDWSAAAAALADQLAETPTPEVAARLAHATQRAGGGAAAGLPAAAGDGAAAEPGSEADALLGEPAPPPAPTPEATAEYLNVLKREAGAIREILGDG